MVELSLETQEFFEKSNSNETTKNIALILAKM